MPPKVSLLLIHYFLVLATVNLVITIPTANEYAERLGAGRLLLVMQIILPTPKALTPTVVVCCYVCAYKSDIIVQQSHFLGERGWGIRKVQSIFIAQWFAEPVVNSILCNTVVEFTQTQQFGGTKMPLHRLYAFVAWHDLVHNKGIHQFTTSSLGVRFRNVDMNWDPMVFFLLEMVVPLYRCDLHQLSWGLLDLWLVSCQSSALLAICSTKSSFLASWSA